MKFWVWAVLCMACVVFTACGDDDSVRLSDSRTVSDNIGGRAWQIDDMDDGRVLYFKNRMVVYLEGGTGLDDIDKEGVGVRLGTWTDNGNSVNTELPYANEMLYGKKEHIVPYYMKMVGVDRNALYMESNNGEHKMTLLGGFADYSDSGRHDDALRGTWTRTITTYDMGSPELYDIHVNITFNGGGTMRYAIPEENVDYTCGYTTKNGAVSMEHYGQYGEMSDYPTNCTYIRNGNTLTFYMPGRNSLHKVEQFVKK